MKPLVVPAAANSIVLTLTDSNGNVTSSGPLVKPTAAWTSPELPPGSCTISASAYPGTVAASLGVAQAAGSGSVVIVAGQNAKAGLTMGSTVATLTISPPAPSVNLGSTSTVSVSATNAAGAIVLIAPATITWSTSDPLSASINPSGLTATVNGLAAGTVTIGATFSEVEPSLGQVPVTTTSPFAVLAGTTTVTVSARPRTR
ncbi:MAG: Ig-like domain-containing protein [Fimbriimonadaceae bacterium]